VGDRIIRRGLEHEEALPDEPGYTIIGGDGMGVLSEKAHNIDGEIDNGE
jgi:hypothetical protein